MSGHRDADISRDWRYCQVESESSGAAGAWPAALVGYPGVQPPSGEVRIVLGKLVALAKRCDFEELGEIEKYPVRNGLVALHDHRWMRRPAGFLRVAWNAFFATAPFQYRPPFWYSYKKSPGAVQAERRAAALFLGSRHPDRRVARWHNEQARLNLIASKKIPEATKEELRAKGPLCSPSDIAHMEWLDGYMERCTDPEYDTMLEAGNPTCRPDDLAQREHERQLSIGATTL